MFFLKAGNVILVCSILSATFCLAWCFQRPVVTLRTGSVVRRFSSSVVTPTPSISDSEDATLQTPLGSKKFDWNKQWYPIAVSSLTDTGRPHKMELLGNDIVLWYDGSQWRVFEDSCPHRNVPLSEGRVEKNGELLCSYHAWKFDGTGQCTSIPQSRSKDKESALMSSAKSCVQSYPTMVEQGLVWCWGEKGLPGSDVSLEAALKRPHLIEELTDPAYTGRILPMTYNFRDLPYGWDMFMENVLDPSHVPVSHHGIVGNRYKDAQFVDLTRLPSRTEISVAEGGSMDPAHTEDRGFNYRVDNKLLGDAGKAYNDFRPPSLTKIETVNKDGSKLILALYATPTKPGFCRHIGAQILIKSVDKKVPKGLGMFALPLPTWLLHTTASLFLHQDQVFLHAQERKLYQSPSNYAFGIFPSQFNMKNDHKSYATTLFTPNEGDKGITTLRRWIHEVAGGGPVWGPSALSKGLPKVLPPTELFDVYESHVKNCKVCQDSLKKIKIIRNSALLSLAVLSIAYGRTLKLWQLLLAAMSGVVVFATHSFTKLFYKYEFHHQDNN